MRSVTAGATARSGRAAGASRAGQRGREAADPHLAARRRVLRREVALELLELREQRVGVAEQHVRGGRQPHAAPGRLEQRVAELALERGQLLRDRRGREMQRVGRGGERPVVGDGAERSQAAEGRP